MDLRRWREWTAVIQWRRHSRSDVGLEGGGTMLNPENRSRIVWLLVLWLLVGANPAAGQAESPFFLPAYAAEFFSAGHPDAEVYAILVGAFAERDSCDLEFRGLCSLQLPSFIRRHDGWRLPHELLIVAPPEWHQAQALLRKLQRCGLADRGLLVKTSRAELLVGLDPESVCLSDHDPLPELCPESGEDRHPQLLRFRRPEYSETARRELIEGVVIIRVLVGARGRGGVHGDRPVTASGPGRGGTGGSSAVPVLAGASGRPAGSGLDGHPVQLPSGRGPDLVGLTFLTSGSEGPCMRLIRTGWWLLLGSLVFPYLAGQTLPAAAPDSLGDATLDSLIGAALDTAASQLPDSMLAATPDSSQMVTVVPMAPMVPMVPDTLWAVPVATVSTLDSARSWHGLLTENGCNAFARVRADSRHYWYEIFAGPAADSSSVDSLLFVLAEMTVTDTEPIRGFFEDLLHGVVIQPPAGSVPAHSARLPQAVAGQTAAGGASSTDQPTIGFLAEPDYPDSLRAEGVAGTTVLNVLVDVDGSVSEVKVVQSLHPVLDEEAAESMYRSFFAPAIKNGVPFVAWITIPVVFEVAPDSPDR
ncbi:MAG: energy transducer TonB [bacterium]